MPDNPVLFAIWGLAGLALGFAMYLFLGGNPLVHMGVGAIAAIAAGAIARSQREKD